MGALALVWAGTRSVEEPAREHVGECSATGGPPAPAGIQTGPPAEGREGSDAPGLSPCNLTGWWENDLGSKMQVFNVDNDGTFSGEYYTAVSSAKKPIQPSPLIGSQHLDEDGQCTFGFTVNWKKFSDSTAVFVGECFKGDDGKEVLHTSWLLREKVDSEPDDWKATRTGCNTFTRTG
uniref:Avidin n=1 Tax=Zosterops lateralis melanops TaxID=1220523 RepID=A0A8D2NX40_ZOSLA